MDTKKTPKVFISYSWDDVAHKQWVRDFATRLITKEGVDVVLDLWEMAPGDQIPEFMERAVRENDFVIIICTPNYKFKMDNRGGGVGYEGDIMSGEIFVKGNDRKFIPILRVGEWKDVAPTAFIGKYYIDLRGDPYNENNYRDLIQTLFDERAKKPILGNRTIAEVVTMNQYEKLMAALNVLADVEFRDLIQSLLSREEQGFLPRPIEIITRTDFLGYIKQVEKMDVLKDYLKKKYGHRLNLI